MKITVTFQMFVDAFNRMDRETSFSYEGMRALFDYIEEEDNSTDHETELDIPTFSCEYAEYDSIDAFNADYPSYAVESMDDLYRYVTVIPIDDKRFIIRVI